MKNDEPIAATQFFNIQVIAIPEIGPDGKKTYSTTFLPEAITVKTHDAVINYQLIDPTPADVIFKGMKVKPAQQGQFSTPSVSQSGKLITFSDANTVKEVIGVTLVFTDKDAGEFHVDPDVDNEPPPN